MAAIHTPDQREPRDDQFASPLSAVSSGWGEVYGTLPHGADENLPEVSMPNGPQALSPIEAEYKRRHFEESDPKYPVLLDDALKTVVSTEGAAPSDMGSGGELQPDTAEERQAAEHTVDAPQKEGRIWGLPRKVFFIFLAVLLLVLAAAVAGGVGGSVAASKKKLSNATTSDNTTSSASTAPLTTTASLTTPASTTTSSIIPSSPTPALLDNLSNQTNFKSLGSKFQAWSGTNYTGNRTIIFEDPDGFNSPFPFNSYVWLSEVNGTKSWCCISLCRYWNSTGLPPSGDRHYTCSNKYQNVTSEPFNRVWVWCGKPPTVEHAYCSPEL